MEDVTEESLEREKELEKWGAPRSGPRELQEATGDC